jgi:hypothetical protein
MDETGFGRWNPTALLQLYGIGKKKQEEKKRRSKEVQRV